MKKLLKRIAAWCSFGVDLRFRRYYVGVSVMDWDPKTISSHSFRIYVAWPDKTRFQRSWSRTVGFKA